MKSSLYDKIVGYIIDGYNVDIEGKYVSGIKIDTVKNNLYLVCNHCRDNYSNEENVMDFNKFIYSAVMGDIPEGSRVIVEYDKEIMKTILQGMYVTIPFMECINDLKFMKYEHIIKYVLDKCSLNESLDIEWINNITNDIYKRVEGCNKKDIRFIVSLVIDVLAGNIEYDSNIYKYVRSIVKGVKADFGYTFYIDVPYILSRYKCSFFGSNILYSYEILNYICKNKTKVVGSRYCNITLGEEGELDLDVIGIQSYIQCLDLERYVKHIKYNGSDDKKYKFIKEEFKCFNMYTQGLVISFLKRRESLNSFYDFIIEACRIVCSAKGKYKYILAQVWDEYFEGNMLNLCSHGMLKDAVDLFLDFKYICVEAS